jgi:hypothetical protein
MICDDAVSLFVDVSLMSHQFFVVSEPDIRASPFRLLALGTVYVICPALRIHKQCPAEEEESPVWWRSYGTLALHRMDDGQNEAADGFSFNSLSAGISPVRNTVTSRKLYKFRSSCVFAVGSTVAKATNYARPTDLTMEKQSLKLYQGRSKAQTRISFLISITLYHAS